MNEGNGNGRQRCVVSDTETVMENLSLEPAPEGGADLQPPNEQLQESADATVRNDREDPSQQQQQQQRQQLHHSQDHGDVYEGNAVHSFSYPHGALPHYHYNHQPEGNVFHQRGPHQPLLHFPPQQFSPQAPVLHLPLPTHSTFSVTKEHWQQHPNGPFSSAPHSSSLPPVHPGLLQYFEAQMRDHAAAYANAAAAAAMTAAQIAVDIAAAGSPNNNHGRMEDHIHHAGVSPPSVLPGPPQLFPREFLSSPGAQTTTFHSEQFSPHTEGPLGYHSNQNLHFHPEHPEFQHHSHHQNKQSSRATCGRGGENNHRRRKRQQPRMAYNDHSERTSFGGSEGKTGNRHHRFWNDAVSSDNYSDKASSAHRGMSRHQHSKCSGSNRRRNRKTALTVASSSSDGGSASWTTKKKQKQLTDESLLGKTGSGALYEWCDKRRITPFFECSLIAVSSESVDGEKKMAVSERVDDVTKVEQEHGDSDDSSKYSDRYDRVGLDQNLYEMLVFIDGIEMGKGRGATKTSAKHDASRNALQVLLPGVEFDAQSGIVVKVPIESRQIASSRLDQWSDTGVGSNRIVTSAATSACLDELAPNLAKQLAIGHPKDEVGDIGVSNRNLMVPKRRGKWPYVYPGTSTTSDDEDGDTYFASRGASVCSSLLHAMIQIDGRLSDAPEYTYEVSAVVDGNQRGTSIAKRTARVPIDATSNIFPRGAFQCYGVLKIQVESDSHSESTSNFDEQSYPRESFQLLRAVGSGATKREARHAAAAKLLALLFPDCEGMAQVKDAAEAAREKYAANRAFKQQSKHSMTLPSYKLNKNDSPKSLAGATSPTFDFALASKENPRVPSSVEIGFVTALEYCNHDACTDNDTQEDCGDMRQLSRLQQLEDQVNNTLQSLNEHDEEGRFLPEELTVDDVGRTVLRRASADDMLWIEELFRSQARSSFVIGRSPLSVLSIDKHFSTEAGRLWSSSTIVLLLCRAIAPHEDPPLGCAVLNLGFSMQKGRVLRLAQIASQSHLPCERFIECLLAFSTSMNCCLETCETLRSHFTTLRKDFVQQILISHLPSLDNPVEAAARDKFTTNLQRKVSRPLEDNIIGALQSVEEEGEGCDESDSSHKKKKGKAQVKLVVAGFVYFYNILYTNSDFTLLPCENHSKRTVKNPTAFRLKGGGTSETKNRDA